TVRISQEYRHCPGGNLPERRSMRQRCARLIWGRPAKRAVLIRAALALAAVLLVPASSARGVTQPRPSRLWILYASDWVGPTEIFAADPSGRSPVRQVTFGGPPDECHWVAACGFSDPMPSPDGHRLAFWSGGVSFAPRTLWLANIDGSGRREVAAAT